MPLNLKSRTFNKGEMTKPTHKVRKSEDERERGGGERERERE